MNTNAETMDGKTTCVVCLMSVDDPCSSVKVAKKDKCSNLIGSTPAPAASVEGGQHVKS